MPHVNAAGLHIDATKGPSRCHMSLRRKLTDPLQFQIGGNPIAIHDTIVLAEWPDAQVAKRYKDTGGLYGERGNPPAANPVWQIDFSFFLEALTDAFWDQKVAVQGPNALKPSKTIGYIRTVKPGSTELETTCVTPHTLAEYDPKVKIPKGYMFVANGLLIRLPPQAPTDVVGASWNAFDDVEMIDV